MPALLELFSGTGSVGRAFQQRGWDVYSIDVAEVAGHVPTWQGDILEWDYTDPSLPRFDVVHASPPCTQYSRARTTARTPRDLDGADALVACALDIIYYMQMRNPDLLWFLENPASGLLATREVVSHLPRRMVSYCAYGMPYRKNTYIWTNAADFWHAKTCPGRGLCPSMVGRRHIATAQRANFPREELYRLPEALCEEIAELCDLRN
jgi:hypothetical protein